MSPLSLESCGYRNNGWARARAVVTTLPKASHAARSCSDVSAASDLRMEFFSVGSRRASTTDSAGGLGPVAKRSTGGRIRPMGTSVRTCTHAYTFIDIAEIGCRLDWKFRAADETLLEGAMPAV